jgi:hypothetical protein
MSPKLKEIADAIMTASNTPISDPLYDLIWYVAELESRLEKLSAHPGVEATGAIMPVSPSARPGKPKK